jgi:hypothetical protein
MPSPADIRAAYTLRGVNVVRYSEGVRRTATGLLESLAARVHRLLLLSDLSTRAKKERVISTITRLSVQHYDSIEEVLVGAMVDLARDESAHFRRVFGRGSGKAMLKREAQALISATLIDGVPLRDWLVGQSMEIPQRVGRLVRLSPAGGTGQDISIAAFGETTGSFVMALSPSGVAVRTPVFKGGEVLGKYRRYLNTVAKSSVHAASQAAALASFRRSSTVTKLELSVILDRRTSQICNSRAGAIWMANSGSPAPESAISEPFPGPPPYHLSCRSMLVPYSDDVAPEIAFNEWISSLSNTEKRDILGVARYNSYKKGTLDLNRVDVGERPLTIEQLRDSY